MRYTLTNQALEDLELIWEYTCHKWSVDQADSYIQQKFKTFDWLLSNIAACKICEDIRPGLKRWKSGRHFTFFELTRIIQIL